MLKFCVKPLLTPTFTTSFKPPNRTYLPRRALLYVPGDDSHKLEKAFAADVDCIAMDCEDGVAMTQKEQARLNIRKILDKGKPPKKRTYDLGIRINSAGTEFFKQDVEVLLTGKNLPNTITLPKVDEVDQLKLFSDQLNEAIKINAKINLIIGIESAKAFLDLKHIIRAATELSKTGKFTPRALLFGSDDFCASIGATRTDSSLEVLYARQKLVLNAKAYDLQAIDMVYIKYKDLEGLKRQSIEGASMGFTGKQVIHPDQVPIVQDAFLPSEARIKWASGLITAFHEHQKSGKGAFTYEGSMIDMPTMRQAQNIVDLVNAVMVHQSA